MKFIVFIVGLIGLYYLSVITSGFILDQVGYNGRKNDKICLIPGVNIVYAFIVLIISIGRDIVRDHKELWKKDEQKNKDL